MEQVNSHLFTKRNVNGHFKVALKHVMQNKIFFFILNFSNVKWKILHDASFSAFLKGYFGHSLCYMVVIGNFPVPKKIAESSVLRASDGRQFFGRSDGTKDGMKVCHVIVSF